MRQFIFVVVMVAAAFAGGAAVNGPGSRWVQTRLLDYMGLKDGGEIASVDLPQPPSDPSDPRRASSSPSTAIDGRATAAFPSPNRSDSHQDQAATSSPSLGHRRTAGRSPARPVGEHTLQGQSNKSHAKGVENPVSARTLADHESPPLPIPAAVPEPAAPRLTNGSRDRARPHLHQRTEQVAQEHLPLATPAQTADSQGALPAPLDASIGPAI